MRSRVAALCLACACVSMHRAHASFAAPLAASPTGHAAARATAGTMVAAEPTGARSKRARASLKKEPPTIAVVGRPNVGKSTIANRMTQAFQRGGLVFDEPGVTRDRTYGYGFWQAHEFRVVDTGGLVFDDEEDRVFLPHIRTEAKPPRNATLRSPNRLDELRTRDSTVAIPVQLREEGAQHDVQITPAGGGAALASA